MTSTYLGYRIYANDITKSLQRVAAEPTAAREQAYYLANIGKVTTVDQFVNNYKLFTYAMKAYGLEDMGNAKAFMKKVLESDLTNSKSFANSLNDSRYRAFAEAYQFTAKGLVTSTAAVQTSSQQTTTKARFATASTASDTDKTAATAYFTANIGKVTSVADLEKDSKLLAYVKTAYGLDDTTSNDVIEKSLESDLSDSKSYANTTGTSALRAMAANFNFAKDGSVANLRQLQSTTNLTATVTAYTAAAGTGTASKAAAATETTYYQSLMPSLTTLDQFLGNSRLVAYAEKAYGLPSTTTTAQLKAVLTSDVNDPKSAANTLGSAYRAFAAAFNVTTSGTIARTANVEAQSKSSLATITNAYLEQTMEDEAGADNTGVQLALYFRRMAPSITSAYQLLGDKALLKVTQTMLGLSSNSSRADIDSQARNITNKLNLADLKDPKKVDKLMARFSALYDLTNNTDSNSSSLVASLFASN